MGGNAGTELQGEIARASAEMTSAFANVALPSIKEAAGLLLGELNPGGPPSGVQKAFGEARATMVGEFEADKTRAAAAIRTQAKQSGLNYSPGAISEAISGVQSSIEREQGSRLRALNFEEANIGMNQTNRMIAQLLRTGSTTAQGALNFGQNASGAANILSQINQQTQQQNASIGSMIGTVAGGLIGTYLLPGIGTVAGAGIGGAGGGAVGAWL